MPELRNVVSKRKSGAVGWLQLPHASHCRGFSLVEALGAMLILTFVILGTLQLYQVGDKQQRTARNYSNAQTSNREAIRRMLRSLRHGFAVQMNDSSFTGSPVSSTATQVIVTVPHAVSGTDHVRFYLSGSTLFGQNGGAAAIAVATDIQSVAFTYYKTTQTFSGTTYTDVSGSPATATEVQIQLVSSSGGTASATGATSTETAYVELRNATLGL